MSTSAPPVASVCMADEPPPKLENGAMYSLTIRCDRPIEGCELIPHAFLQIKGGNLDNLGKSKLLEASPFELVYRWSRGTPQKFCQNPRCPRGDSYLPVHWAKAVSNGPELLCLVCESGGVPSHECVFCSPT